MKKRILMLSLVAVCLILITVAAMPKSSGKKPVHREKTTPAPKPPTTCGPVSNIHSQHVGLTLIIYFDPPTTQYNNFTYQLYSTVQYGHTSSGTVGQSGFEIFPWQWGQSHVNITSHCTCQPNSMACDGPTVGAYLP